MSGVAQQPPGSELRRDPVTGSWVIFAPQRAGRPHDFVERRRFRTAPEGCPFCPGHEEQTPPELMRFPAAGEYPGQPWSLRVVPDKFPMLKPGQTYHRFGEGMFDLMDGHGHHEQVIESPLHDEEFDMYRDSHVRTILHVYQNRCAELGRDERIHQVLIARNSGSDAGEGISHPNTHVVALPIVPKRILEEVAGSHRYYKFKERCLYCDIIQQEQSEGTRVVAQNDAFIAFCAYAGRSPFEIVVTPRQHNARFEAIRPNEIALLAELFKGVLGTLQRCLERPPMNFIFHTAPTPQACRDDLADATKYYHWHIEIIPKLTRTAGFEWGSGYHINPILPEDAARWLREAVSPTGPVHLTPSPVAP